MVCDTYTAGVFFLHNIHQQLQNVAFASINTLSTALLNV